MSERAAWLREVRLEMERGEDDLSPVFDERWGQIEAPHRRFVEGFLRRLPPRGAVLDAACGTGKYFGLVLESGRSVVGADHSGGHLARAAEKFTDVPTEKRTLQDLPYRSEFDGVMCVDAMEFVPPEEWPAVLEGFRRALREPGWLYLTVEKLPQERIVELTAEARADGSPVVDGEAYWKDEPLYHHYPSMEQVRRWLDEAGFDIEEDEEGPWDQERYAYHHLVARARPG